jgi:hypothetical protein
MEMRRDGFAEGVFRRRLEERTIGFASYGHTIEAHAALAVARVEFGFLKALALNPRRRRGRGGHHRLEEVGSGRADGDGADHSLSRCAIGGKP